ncbi:hypothetical protein A2690_02760 [Candidatus Roizmanbacteria bacterium RIFCSPHIGHO2_01_FULL_39_12b]|uniref:Phosphatidic acid phosphatase type 2/haloperoxidase domain-containing protein n=1 Tax=Candidatus Roizmanbacteria bacterium RIFCSPHIGHO2_01_FULL_39_12b TaxID=1802030 RepID=A0A1F7GBH5_9BACT|nr:MAG: hypothetical protein A2690_02760 [Candidatus Roizmanbacteria bacterium RIFCSPHIGHO2_01_FULL_39_12b]
MDLISIVVDFDKTITLLISSLPANTFVVILMRFFSFEGIFALIWFAICAYIYKKCCVIKHKHTIIFELLVLLLVVNALLNVAIKPLFKKPRPFATKINQPYIQKPFIERLLQIPNIENNRPPQSVPYPQDYSFPSGHATLAFVVTAFLSMKDRKRSSLYVFLAFIVAFSRIYLGYHYVSDVLGGAIIGLVSTHVFLKFSKTSLS